METIGNGIPLLLPRNESVFPFPLLPFFPFLHLTSIG